MFWRAMFPLLAVAVGTLLAPAALAHELSPAGLAELAEAAHETADAARTLAQLALAAGLAGLAAGVVSLAISLRRR